MARWPSGCWPGRPDGGPMTRVLAVAPTTDIITWLRGRGLEIVLLVLR